MGQRRAIIRDFTAIEALRINFPSIDHTTIPGYLIKNKYALVYSDGNGWLAFETDQCSIEEPKELASVLLNWKTLIDIANKIINNGTTYDNFLAMLLNHFFYRHEINPFNPMYDVDKHSTYRVYLYEDGTRAIGLDRFDVGMRSEQCILVYGSDKVLTLHSGQTINYSCFVMDTLESGYGDLGPYTDTGETLQLCPVDMVAMVRGQLIANGYYDDGIDRYLSDTTFTENDIPEEMHQEYIMDHIENNGTLKYFCYLPMLQFISKAYEIPQVKDWMNQYEAKYKDL